MNMSPPPNMLWRVHKSSLRPAFSCFYRSSSRFNRRYVLGKLVGHNNNNQRKRAKIIPTSSSEKSFQNSEAGEPPPVSVSTTTNDTAADSAEPPEESFSLKTTIKNNLPSLSLLILSIAALKLPTPLLATKKAFVLLLPKLGIYASIRSIFKQPVRTLESFIAKKTAAALLKIKVQWKSAIIIPFAAAAVGWVTNWLAVQMIFYPIGFLGLPPFHQPVLGSVCGEPYHSPLGYFGWQGIVPAKAAKMAGAMTTMVTTQLIDVTSVFAKLDPNAVASRLLETAPAHAMACAFDVAGGPWSRGLPLASTATAWAADHASRLPNAAVHLLATVHHEYIVGLVELLKGGIEHVLDLNTMVVSAMCDDKRVLVELFQKCATKELAFLVDSGLWFGFLLGVLQMFVWGFTDAPWTLPVGGAVVGYLTNWIALKCIFEPVDPVKVGPWTLQGMFLKRQNEVSETFADHMAENVLTSENFFQRLLPPGGDAKAFGALAAAHTDSFGVDLSHRIGMGVNDGAAAMAQRASTAAAGGVADAVASTSSSALGEGLGEYMPSLADSLVRTMPDHLPRSLHEYVDATLGLREEMTAKLKAMAPSDFERVLHPIFEEDEFTLIVAGGILGLLVGLAQMLFEKRETETKNNEAASTKNSSSSEQEGAPSPPPPPPPVNNAPTVT